MSEGKYKMRVVRGAFTNPSKLDELGAKTVEQLERSEWQSIDEIEVDVNEIKKLQKIMIRHFDDKNVPWYMDGYRVGDKNNLIVAFGADDGEGGKIFRFSRGDKSAIAEVVQYGIKKGIPAEQMDFMETDF